MSRDDFWGSISRETNAEVSALSGGKAGVKYVEVRTSKQKKRHLESHGSGDAVA